MTKRYSHLKPLEQDERAALSVMLCNFFSPLNNEKIRKELGLPIEPSKLQPLPLFEFFKWNKQNGLDLWPKSSKIRELVLKLEQKGFLESAGSSGGSPGLSNCYYFFHEFSTLAGKGNLWLGLALGADYIGHAIKSVIALITGTTPKGDPAVGTGLLVLPGIVLTCAHVVDDMIIDSDIEILGQTIAIREHRSDSRVDVGVLLLEDASDALLPDLGFRKATDLEEVIIAGYPTIPRGLSPTITLQRGEISGRVEKTIDGYPLELFSAIARPGNSGGPVVSMDGRVVGIVSRSLERPREDADAMVPMPFFSAVPSDVIQSSFRDLTNGLELPWETYE